MMPRSRRSASRDVPTSVYRYYDRHDLLIYVGITSRGMIRNQEHNRGAAWWQYVTRQEVDHFRTRNEAETHEKALIIEHRPPFNKRHNPDSDALRTAYMQWMESEAAKVDAIKLYSQLGRLLPLQPMGEHLPDRIIFRTAIEHHAIANHLHLDGQPSICGSPRLGRITSVKMHGLVALIRIDGRNLPAVSMGFVSLKCSNKPLRFTVGNVEIRRAVPRKPWIPPDPPTQSHPDPATSRCVVHRAGGW